jgi:hypothetical protein
LQCFDFLKSNVPAKYREIFTVFCQAITTSCQQGVYDLILNPLRLGEDACTDACTLAGLEFDIHAAINGIDKFISREITSR